MKLEHVVAAANEDAGRLLEATYERMRGASWANVIIEEVPFDQVARQLKVLRERKWNGESLPLFGVPFVVKDNMDVFGTATTAGCPAYAYRPNQSAFAVRCLEQVGALAVGKTNLDQFATGLVGIRSPYGECRSAIDSRYIAGGSSSGSALAVAHGIVPFALGTDTAGSGRVPAAFNGIVGLKPTRGIISTQGVVPACRSLDCVSVFAVNVDDAVAVWHWLARHDTKDVFARPWTGGVRRLREGEWRIGVPRHVEFFGNREFELAFSQYLEVLAQRGHICIPIDVEPFIEAGRLLYGGPWVAERFASVGEFIERDPGAVHPVVRDIILAGKMPSAHELFRAQYRLMELQRLTMPLWDEVDLLALPTTGTIYTVDQVRVEPITTNANLGRYTNFVNLLDLAALALPRAPTPSGAPFGVSLIGPAFSELKLVRFAQESEA